MRNTAGADSEGRVFDAFPFVVDALAELYSFGLLSDNDNPRRAVRCYPQRRFIVHAANGKSGLRQPFSKLRRAISTLGDPLYDGPA